MAAFVFFSHPPRPELAPFVRSIWGVRGASGAASEAVLPNGSTELMVGFGPEQRIVAHGERRLDDRFRDAWIAGPQDRRLVHVSAEGVDHVSVSFRPGGAHAFFDLPMDRLANRVLPLDGLLGPVARSLRDRLLAEASDSRRVAVLQDWLVEQRRDVDPAFATVRRAMRLLADPEPRHTVLETCERLGLSNGHLVRTFRRTVGLTPKTVARIARFQAVLRATRHRLDVDWSGLAAELGYCDQSHLVREVRRFSCVAPTELVLRRVGDDALAEPA